MEIEVLHRQGKGIREIARETGVARNTIRAILAGKSDGHTARASRARRSSTRTRTTCKSASRRPARSGCRRRCCCARSAQGLRRRHHAAQRVPARDSAGAAG